MISVRPAGPLSAYVETLWWSERGSASAAGEHHLPSGAAQLVVALHDEQIHWTDAGGNSGAWRRGVMHGARADWYATPGKPAGIVVGASFHPHAAAAFFGVSAAELAAKHTPLEALWGGELERLREEIAQPAALAGGDGTPPAVRGHAALTVLEERLTRRIETPVRTPAWTLEWLSLVDACDEGLQLRAFARQTGLSERQIIAAFHACVGLTPMRYARVRRFARAIARLARAPEASKAGLAATAGYADQAHFTREFRALAGTTPGAYRPASAGSPHHHLIDEGRA